MPSNFTKQIIPIFLFQSLVNIPNWLLRIPEKKLSYAAKILYGYMSTVSSCEGIFEIFNQNFLEEIAMSSNTYIKALKELNDAKLINFRSKNEYEFYSHIWMEGKYDEEF